MSKLIIVLLVVTSTFQICLADTPTVEENNEDETQAFDEIPDEWNESTSTSASSNSAASSSSRLSSSQTQMDECEPPEIPPKQPQCGPNEVYDPCPDCSPQTCETMNKSYHCPLFKTRPGCKPSCRCQKGYYRNKIGECIAASDCLKCTKPHEYFSCGGACDNVCDTIKEQNQTNCPIINIKCNEMCYCEKGYARDYKNDCIPIYDCPTCPTNERYDPCPATLCSAQNCDQAGFPLNCTPREEGCPCPGKPGCVCKDGYLRNKKGICVPSSECPSCGGDKNATLGCGVNCNRHCSDLNQKPRPCILICYPNSCDCRTDKNGNKYYYDDNTKKCVLPQDCTPTCKANEEYSDCINGGCKPLNCSQLGKPVPCAKWRPGACIEGCVCKSGYLRAENGTCIPEKQCPSCGDDPNAESGCGTFCETCANYKKGPVACPDICQINGCQCKKGYIYDQNRKKCVLPKQCIPTCKANEVYSDCINGGCEPRNCSQLGFPVPCVKLNPDACIKGCICAPGYLRAKNGTCIPIKQCPSCGGDPNAESGCGVFCERCTGPIPCPKICKVNGCQCKRGHVYDDKTKRCVLPKHCTPKCGTNEEFDQCPDCSPQTCETMNNTYYCPLRPANKTGPNCKPSCRCKKGFFSNKIGQCIAGSDCLKCTKPHEYFSCGGACDNVCATLKEQNQTHCPIVNIKCNEMCYCESGYARDHKNNCVLIKDCPTQCGVNERYVKCPTSLCVPKTCDQLGKPIACPRIIPGRCPDKPACVCIEGYVRNSKGVCIPKGHCPSCGGDKNAQSGCGFLCSEQCGRTKPAPKDCPCEINGCVCKPEYIYDKQQNKCVKWGHCSPKCDENEVFTSCANGGCGKWNCTQYYEPQLCIDPIECFGGCICKKDYLGAPNGTCIQQDQCPAALCPKQNEIYDSCPLACPPRKCGVDDGTVLCSADQPCLPAGCRCQDGYYRNNDGLCVTWEECPSETEPYTCDGSVDQLLEDGNYVWTGKFMHEVIKRKPNESTIMSAFSVLVPIGELALYAEGDTFNQLIKTLNLRSKADIRCVFPRLIGKLRAEQNIILNIANRIFSTDRYPLSENFLDDTENVFDAVAECVDFNQPRAAADRINEWVATETNDRIKDIATPDMFNGDTRLVLANAIYFLGNWIRQFDSKNTVDRDFHVSKQKTIQIPTMYQESSFKYGEDNNLNCKILEMFYKGGNFSFVVYLPNDVEGLPSLVAKLKEPSAFFDSYGATSYQKVQVHLPKIKIESEFDLSQIMQSAGMTDIFDEAKSNLNGILKEYEPLFVSAAKQKSFGVVDEKGTEAAAANVFVGATVTSVQEPRPVYVFDANHPFIFYIFYGRTPIFSGYFIDVPGSS